MEGTSQAPPLPALRLAVGLGAAAQVSQVLVLREVLGQVEGNEVVVGVVLFAWCLSGAFGALAGRRLAGRGGDPARRLTLVLLVAAAVAAASLHGIRMARGLLPLAPGEAVDFADGLIVAAVAGAVPAFAFGFGFPLAAATLSGRRAFAAEAAGAVVGGVAFTFLAASLPPLAVAIGLVALVSLLAVGVRPALALPLLVASSAGTAFGPAIDRASREAAYAAYLPRLALVATAQSKRGPLDVLALPGQSSLYRLGHLDFTSPDAEGAAVRAHVALTLHPAPKRVLVAGGGPSVIREALLEPVSQVFYAETDPDALDVMRPHLAVEDRAALSDPRVTVLAEDPRAALRRFAHDLDVVALFGVEPSTAAANRFFTAEFYAEAARALREEGVLVESLPGVENTLPDDVLRRNALVRAAAKTAFRHVLSTPGEAGFLVATSAAAPPSLRAEDLAARFRSRDVATRAFTEHHFGMLFPPGAVETLKTALRDAEARLGGERNDDLHPAAFRRTLALKARESGTEVDGVVGTGFARAIAAALLAALLLLAWKGPRGAASIASTGFAGMGGSVVVLLGYQAARGDLYGEVGALAAASMAGIALGSLVRLPLVVLDLALAALLAATPLAHGDAVLWFAVAVGIGFAVGASYPAAIRARTGPGATSERGPDAVLYALDLAGAALGALFVGALFVPVAGVPVTCLSLAAAKALLAGAAAGTGLRKAAARTAP